MTLGEALAHLRSVSGLPLQAVALHADVTVPELLALEADEGQPPYDLLWRVVQVYLRDERDCALYVLGTEAIRVAVASQLAAPLH